MITNRAAFSFYLKLKAWKTEQFSWYYFRFAHNQVKNHVFLHPSQNDPNRAQHELWSMSLAHIMRHTVLYRYVCFVNNSKFKAPRIHTINIDYKSIFRGSYQFNSKWHWNLFVRGFFLTFTGLVLIIIINNRHGKNQLHFILNYLYVPHSMWSVFLINMWALRKVPSNRMCRACLVWKQSLRNDTLHMAHLSHFVLMKAMNIFQLVWLKLCRQGRMTKRYGWWKIIANKLLTIIWAIQTSFQQVVQFLNQLNRMKSDT